MKRLFSVVMACCLVAACGDKSPQTPPTGARATVASGAKQPGAQSSVPKGPHAPRDECGTEPGFAAFRVRLNAAVAARDARALASLADPGIRLDFGGGGGSDELIKRLGGPDGAHLWDELAALRDLGCAWDEPNAVMPWIFARAPEPSDPYRAYLVTGNAVPLRAGPAADAPVVRTLGWELVSKLGNVSPVKAEAVEVETLDGTARGFVSGEALRGLLGYRLLAVRRNGEWKITAFVAGD